MAYYLWLPRPVGPWGVRLGSISLGQARLGSITLSQVRLGQVKSGQRVLNFIFFAKTPQVLTPQVVKQSICLMFFSHSFRRSDFTYGDSKDQNVESLLCQKTFRRSDFTYGVTKDQNVESLLCQKTFRCSDFTYGVEKDIFLNIFMQIFL